MRHLHILLSSQDNVKVDAPYGAALKSRMPQMIITPLNEVTEALGNKVKHRMSSVDVEPMDSVNNCLIDGDLF